MTGNLEYRTEMENWTLYHLPFWKSVTLIDGSRSRDIKVMRRKIGGEWQYRVLTSNETREYLESDCW